ncbi:MAG: HDIG domain-containing metalloprotein [PVC group bacterium]
MIRISLKNTLPGARFPGKRRRRAGGGKGDRPPGSGVSGRWILGAAVFAASVLIISWRGMPLSVPVIGQTSERDVVAACGFLYPDQIKTAQARAAAEDRQPVAYAVVPAVPEEKRERVKDFFGGLSGVGPAAPIGLLFSPPRRILSIFLKTVLSPDDEERLLLLLEKSYRNGVISPDIKRTLLNTRQEQVVLVGRSAGAAEEVFLAAIPAVDAARQEAVREIEEKSPSRRPFRAELEELVSFLIQPDLEFDPGQTEELRAAALRSVPVVMTAVEKGDTIIRQGEKVRPLHVQKFRSYQEEFYRLQPPIALFYYMFGTGLLVLLLALITAYFLDRYHRAVSRSGSRLLMICAVVVLILVFARGLRQVVWILPPGLMEGVRFVSPVAIGSLLLCLLFEARVAIFFPLILSFLTALILGGDLGYMLVGVIGGTAGVVGLSGARRRIDLFRAGVVAAAAGALTVVALGISRGLPPLVFFSQGAGAAAAGILSAFIALVVLGLFEWIFRVSSDIELLELSDLNHPLLRRLMVCAPGTYHHSLMVATLAEGAAEEVGANSLLARASAYFHDVGKIGKPEYFSENEISETSRHDDLIPSMSSLILISHVKEGAALARQHKLDRRIVANIEQHHGTSRISYFYDRAERARQPNAGVPEENYRYPGPKPASREAAIIMLADAAEAASVSLDRPTPARLEALIKNIVRERLVDGQFDECRLTLADLKIIEESFVRSLSARYHTRVKYPEGNGE